MGANPYDQASRYLARLDPLGLLRWLFAAPSARLRFLSWLDSRNIPFPGEPDRTGDTIACLEDEEEPGPLWAVPIEFQSKPDADMFGRLLEYLGTFWRHIRPADRPNERYGVVACLVNLTGAGNSTRDFQLAGARTLLQPCECNLALQDAALVLAGIATGEIARCVLPFIPLMQKGAEASIITQWLELARAEPDERRRSDYGGLALVFADLADCRPVWKQALKEWNMQQSQQVLEWQQEAEQRGLLLGEQRGVLLGLQNALRISLEARFSSLSGELLARIEQADNPEKLRFAIRQVHELSSPDDLAL